MSFFLELCFVFVKGVLDARDAGAACASLWYHPCLGLYIRAFGFDIYILYF